MTALITIAVIGGLGTMFVGVMAVAHAVRVSHDKEHGGHGGVRA